MNQTGHRSTDIVRRYIRYGSLFGENAAARVGPFGIDCDLRRWRNTRQRNDDARDGQNDDQLDCLGNQTCY